MCVIRALRSAHRQSIQTYTKQVIMLPQLLARFILCLCNQPDKNGFSVRASRSDGFLMSSSFRPCPGQHLSLATTPLPPPAQQLSLLLVAFCSDVPRVLTHISKKQKNKTKRTHTSTSYPPNFSPPIPRLG